MFSFTFKNSSPLLNSLNETRLLAFKSKNWKAIAKVLNLSSILNWINSIFFWRCRSWGELSLVSAVACSCWFELRMRKMFGLSLPRASWILPGMYTYKSIRSQNLVRSILPSFRVIYFTISSSHPQKWDLMCCMSETEASCLNYCSVISLSTSRSPA